MKPRTNPHRGGRPRKFTEPSRPITTTLPVRVLNLLSAVDSDRAKAITKLADSSLNASRRPLEPVAMVSVGAGKALILVSYSERLTRIP